MRSLKMSLLCAISRFEGATTVAQAGRQTDRQQTDGQSISQISTRTHREAKSQTERESVRRTNKQTNIHSDV